LNVAARLLANENVPGAVIAALRQQGHDVAWIHQAAPGTTDTDVLERAQREGRVVVTFDKDFGELAFRRGLAASVGGQFAVVEDDRIRLRALPS
jgi:predicted nuclease of predicted toxin-antitoxin system